VVVRVLQRALFASREVVFLCLLNHLWGGQIVLPSEGFGAGIWREEFARHKKKGYGRASLNHALTNR
jgi:hypothetical protein